MSGTRLSSVSSAVEVTRGLLRQKRGPFRSGVGKPLLLHCSHHKVGTVWFTRVLRAVAKNFDLRFEIIGTNRPAPGSQMLLFNNAYRFKPEYVDGRSFRGSHIIRDPRDVVVSAYHYHLRTSEEWVVTPSERWGGQSYQEYLHSLSLHDGLIAEIKRCVRPEFESMREWDYEQPEFLELRYEDVLRDESDAFERIFHHYEFRSNACKMSVETARSFSLDVVRAGQDAHVRSGLPGEWRKEFTPELTTAFKQLTGDLVVRLGYETTSDW